MKIIYVGANVSLQLKKKKKTSFEKEKMQSVPLNRGKCVLDIRQAGSDYKARCQKLKKKNFKTLIKRFNESNRLVKMFCT